MLDASGFRIVSINRESNNVRIKWNVVSGRTNALQRTVGAVGGSYATNSFADIFTVTNAVGLRTNFIDNGKVTNFPLR
jgi:hypothetical protein